MSAPPAPAPPSAAPQTEPDSTVDAFSELGLVVVGDAMLDVYLHGAAPRLSREAPVPVVDVHRQEPAPGGAANAAVNAAALGARTALVAVVGADAEGDELIGLLERAGVDVSAVVRDPTRRTVVKRRLLADGQMLVQFDEGTEGPLAPESEAALAAHASARAAGAHVVLASEYAGGVLEGAVGEALAGLSAAPDGPVLLVDGRDPGALRGLRPSVATPNWAEAQTLLGRPLLATDRPAAVAAAAEEILAATGARVAAVTLDADGAVVLEPGRPAHRTYARPAEEASCAGAGDTWAAAFGLALAAGASTTAAAELASAAAAVAVAKPGTATCSSAELRGALLPVGKVLPDAARLAALGADLRAQGRRVAFTNGCFDILHRGHVTFLSEAKARGDVLVVGVNSDASVARLKGPERPINPLADRLEVLAGLSCVDHLVAFDSDRPEDLLRALAPEVYVKGGDYTPATLPEAPLVESLGGRVEILGYLADRSTTRLVERVRGSG